MHNVKLLFFFRFENLLRFSGRGVLLIRNPFQSILSWYRHNEVGPHSESEVGQLALSSWQREEDQNIFFSEQFQRFARQNIQTWKQIIEDWVIVGDVLVVHFEDVLSDRMYEVGRILDFLNLERNETRLACLQYCKVDMYKRNSRKLEMSPYTAETRDIINQSIKSADKLLVKHGHPGIPLHRYSIQ